jgi:hypothetical protein
MTAGTATSFNCLLRSRRTDVCLFILYTPQWDRIVIITANLYCLELANFFSVHIQLAAVARSGFCPLHLCWRLKEVEEREGAGDKRRVSITLLSCKLPSPWRLSVVLATSATYSCENGANTAAQNVLMSADTCVAAPLHEPSRTVPKKKTTTDSRRQVNWFEHLWGGEIRPDVVLCSSCELIALMMEAVQTSETSVNSYQSTRRYNPQDGHLRVNYFAAWSFVVSKCHLIG